MHVLARVNVLSKRQEMMAPQTRENYRSFK